MSKESNFIAICLAVLELLCVHKWTQRHVKLIDASLHYFIPKDCITQDRFYEIHKYMDIRPYCCVMQFVCCYNCRLHVARSGVDETAVTGMQDPNLGDSLLEGMRLQTITAMESGELILLQEKHGKIFCVRILILEASSIQAILLEHISTFLNHG